MIETEDISVEFALARNSIDDRCTGPLMGSAPQSIQMNGHWIVSVVVGSVRIAHHSNELAALDIDHGMTKRHGLAHHPVSVALNLNGIEQQIAIIVFHVQTPPFLCSTNPIDRSS